MTELFAAEHAGALLVIAAMTAGLVVLGRRRPGLWLRGLALVLVAGMRLHPRPWAVAQVALVTVAYTGFVGLVDAVTGSDYMYLRSKPSSPTLLDELGPWPLYLLSASLIGIVLLAILDAPFRIGRVYRSRQGRADALR